MPPDAAEMVLLIVSVPALLMRQRVSEFAARLAEISAPMLSVSPAETAMPPAPAMVMFKLSATLEAAVFVLDRTVPVAVSTGCALVVDGGKCGWCNWSRRCR